MVTVTRHRTKLARDGALLVLVLGLLTACGAGEAPNPAKGASSPQKELEGPAPHLVLVTLDTTRADALTRDDVPTPNLDLWRQGGLEFVRAYSTVPETLPAHASMLTGELPAELQLHENGRVLRADVETVVEQLQSWGYRTAAFVSGFPLISRFGLARGFDHYDDDFEGVERSAAATNQALAAHFEVPVAGSNPAARTPEKPTFVWVHYFDPHDPYEPPEDLLAEIGDPYLAEIAALDREIGRLREILDSVLGDYGVLVVADHGEGRGDHGEMLHGNLLYEGVMRVPFFAHGASVEPGVDDEPISIRAVHDLLLGWAGGGDWASGLDRLNEQRARNDGVVLGEAMKPYLQYGWQPQVMAVEGPLKVIRDGGLQVFDVVRDPRELEDLSDDVTLSAALREALRSAPVPNPAASDAPVDEEDRRRLATLGYVTFSSAAVAREDAPNPRDMVELFEQLDLASAQFSAGDYAAAATWLEQLRRADPGNPSVLLRLAVARSFLGEETAADRLFQEAARVSGESLDLRQYRALHALRFGRFDEAAGELEEVLAADPRRSVVRAALIGLHERRGDARRALPLLRAAAAEDPENALLQRRLGDAAMALGITEEAVAAFERARALAPREFASHLELGVLYQAQRRFAEARNLLDQAPGNHPARPLLLFKRAQLAVLLNEPDAARHVAAARREANGETRELIERERLFEGY